jgi:hypothetical protein
MWFGILIGILLTLAFQKVGPVFWKWLSGLFPDK